MRVVTTTHEIIGSVKKTLPFAEEIYLFGSYSKNQQHRNSDIDLIVKIKEGVDIDETTLTYPNYIDLFVLKNTEIINLSSRYTIRENSKESLEKRLKPVKIWDSINNKCISNNTFTIANSTLVKLTGGDKIANKTYRKTRDLPKAIRVISVPKE